MSNLWYNANHTPLNGESRAQLLAKVYTIILSPEWEKSEEPPKLQPKQHRNQKRKKANQDDC